jgi:hypothetical protein
MPTHNNQPQQKSATAVSNTMNTRSAGGLSGNKRLSYRSQKAVPIETNESMQMAPLEKARSFWGITVRGGNRKHGTKAKSRARRLGLLADCGGGDVLNPGTGEGLLTRSSFRLRGVDLTSGLVFMGWTIAAGAAGGKSKNKIQSSISSIELRLDARGGEGNHGPGNTRRAQGCQVLAGRGRRPVFQKAEIGRRHRA